MLLSNLMIPTTGSSSRALHAAPPGDVAGVVLLTVTSRCVVIPHPIWRAGDVAGVVYSR